LTEVTPAVLNDHTLSAEHVKLMEKIHLRSHMAVPLVARGRILGALNLGSTLDERRYQTEDLALAEDLALRAALAIDNARLYKEATDAILIRDEFLSIASHELRTPLTPLLLHTNTLLARVGDLAKGVRSQEWLEERLEKIARQGSRLERLVGQLLDVSRITAGRLHLDLEAVDLVSTVREVQQRFIETEEIARSGCTVSVAEGQKQLIGRWDRMRLEQVVENLLSNALKYGAGRPVEIRVSGEGSTGILVVRDYGMGLAPPDRERVFGKFERAVSVRHYGGLGMGLFIVKQVVEALGGSVEVESELGSGARFIVQLPIGGPPAAPVGKAFDLNLPSKGDASESQH
jgi:signal transduction histidine kinase